MTATKLNLGDLINLFYEEYLALYGDEDIASVAAAATINDILSEPTSARTASEEEAAA